MAMAEPAIPNAIIEFPPSGLAHAWQNHRSCG
jgi:hypothetical protein